MRVGNGEVLDGACLHAFREIIVGKAVAQCRSKEMIRRTLLHEIAHAANSSAPDLKPGADGHGPRFFRELKRLHRRGEESLRAQVAFYALPLRKRNLVSFDAVESALEDGVNPSEIFEYLTG